MFNAQGAKSEAAEPEQSAEQDVAGADNKQKSTTLDYTGTSVNLLQKAVFCLELLALP